MVFLIYFSVKVISSILKIIICIIFLSYNGKCLYFRITEFNANLYEQLLPSMNNLCNWSLYCLVNNVVFVLSCVLYWICYWTMINCQLDKNRAYTKHSFTLIYHMNFGPSGCVRCHTTRCSLIMGFYSLSFSYCYFSPRRD